SDGRFIWTAEDYGTLSCFDAATGKRLWEQFIDASFHSSPIVAGNTVYLTSTDGSTYLFEPGNAWRQVARLELGEKVETTPALIEGRIVVRGETHLYCIGRKP
ncbi:MAG: PQQ-binding-like beta-propeller repeat protein, partial [Planctomycetota bacterium]